MRLIPVSFLLGCAVTAVITVWIMRGEVDEVQAKVAELESVVTTQKSELLGYTSYTTFLTVSKRSLTEQLKLLTATVVREEGVTQVIERSLLGMSSKGTIAIWYSAEYSFGFDLNPEQYEVVPTPTGIEVRIKKPILVATPAVSQLKFKVLAGGLFTDEKVAVIGLYEEAARRAKTQGLEMAKEPPIIALCEKKLIAFLHDFLSKQPGVKLVPQISVVYV